VPASVKTSRRAPLVGYGAGVAEEAPLPVPPTQARGVRKRDRIFEAAIRRYERDGMGATRVEDVIADAGVSWATFFRYFPRKGDVLIELAARHFREHVRAVAADGLDDRRLRVRTVIERTFAALLSPQQTSEALHSAALLEVFAGPGRFAALVDDGHPQPMVGLVAEVLGEGARRGELRAGTDPAAAALALVAGTLFPAVQAAGLGTDPDPPLRSALALIWDGLGA
jgi:AcrR family transcriptional regulator